MPGEAFQRAPHPYSRSSGDHPPVPGELVEFCCTKPKDDLVHSPGAIADYERHVAAQQPVPGTDRLHDRAFGGLPAEDLRKRFGEAVAAEVERIREERGPAWAAARIEEAEVVRAQAKYAEARRDPRSTANTLRPHGPVFARGDQSYAHLGAMQVGPPDDLASHLVRDHGVVPASREVDASWCRRVEQHADAHDVTLYPKGSS